MRTVKTKPPSFPEVRPNEPLDPAEPAPWLVVCGDPDHWRVGLYSPAEQDRGEVGQLERHDCPELFLLLRGELTLMIAEQGSLREVPLRAGRPVLVTAPHGGFCPGGPHTGVALVVERDAFETEYRAAAEWVEGSSASDGRAG